MAGGSVITMYHEEINSQHLCHCWWSWCQYVMAVRTCLDHFTSDRQYCLDQNLSKTKMKQMRDNKWCKTVKMVRIGLVSSIFHSHANGGYWLFWFGKTGRVLVEEWEASSEAKHVFSCANLWDNPSFYISLYKMSLLHTIYTHGVLSGRLIQRSGEMCGNYHIK